MGVMKAVARVDERAWPGAPLVAGILGVAVTVVVTLTFGQLDDATSFILPASGLSFTALIVSILRAEARSRGLALRAIEALQRSEERRRTSDARARRIFESNVVGVVVSDGRGAIREANDAFLRLVRCTREDLLSGRIRWSDITPLEYHALDERALGAVALGGVETPYEKEYLRRDGSRVPVLVATARIDPDHDAYVSFVIDLSERKRVERERSALLSREQEARAEAEALNRVGRSLSGELDTRPLVQSLTDAAVDLVGADVGVTFYDLTRGKPLEHFAIAGPRASAFAKLQGPVRVTPLLAATLQVGMVVRSGDVVHDPRFGLGAHGGFPPDHPRIASYLAVPVLSRQGQIIGAILLGHAEPNKFTERHERLVTSIAAQAAIALDNARLLRANQEALREAEAANRMKDEFLAIVSHELRTPLHAILGWSRILREEGWSRAEILRGLETIERNAKAQAKLVDDLLDVSRIVSGKLRLDTQLVEPEVVLERALETVAAAAASKGIELEKTVGADLGVVSGDPGRLQQIFWNLLTNAIKFTPPCGRVRVELVRSGRTIELSVSDTGQGISPDFLPFVFDRFRQADGSATRQHGGLGLGLAIVRHLVELHGGAVSASSDGEGRGARFVVTLPVARATVAERTTGRRAAHPTPEPSPEARPEETLDGVRVLVVDDEPDARELLETIFSAANAVVTTAGSVREALVVIHSSPPDLLVSDVGMPTEDGYSLIREVRSLPPEEGGATPAIALTAFVREEDRRRAFSAGFQVHVPKPVDADELLRVSARLASKRELPVA
ncbi:ATP-binding protein [Myxococcota bacterium]|nr:ATP-binding protein [Myxococcota bacterium]